MHISCILILALLLTPILSPTSVSYASSAAKTFSDTAGYACENAVNLLAENNVISGSSDGNFHPKSNLTRAEMAVLITKLLNKGETPDTVANFTDLKNYNWASPYIGYMVENGISNGYQDGTFKPGYNLTYNEAITMIVRALGYKNLEGSYPQKYTNQANKIGFTDGIYFNGNSYATRGDIAIMLCSAFFKTNTYGNTASNLEELGAAARQGDWIYYASSLYRFTGEPYIYKIRTDGTKKTLVCDDPALYLNVVGDWIYYVNDEDGKIYKIRTDGDDKTLINDDYCSCQSLTVVGDWMYYCCGLDIYKMRVDGMGKTKMEYSDVSPTNYVVRYTVVIDDYLYWDQYGSSLHKIRTDGSGYVKIKKLKAYDTYFVAGDWLYYIANNRSIWKIHADGTSKTELINKESTELNVSGDKVYFTSDIESNGFGKLYKMNTDGTNVETVVGENGCTQISVVGDWIFYKTYQGGYKLYKIRTDGTEGQLAD